MKKKITLMLATLLCLTACGNPGGSDTPVGPNPDTDNPGGGDTGGDTNPDTSDTYEIFSVEEKASLAAFRNARKNDTNFINHEGIYKIGDDNAFNFKPEVTVIKNDEAEVMDVAIAYQLEKQVTENETTKFVKLTDEELTNYVQSFDKYTCDIDFTEAAVGNTFKLTYGPEELTEEQQKDPELHADLIFTVLDGANITQAKQLGYMNNDYNRFPTIGTQGGENEPLIRDEWNKFKKANGMSEGYDAHGIFLHNSITITADDLPSEYFLDADDVAGLTTADELKGKLKDWVTFYYREMNKDEVFNMSGNYFTIDVTNFPKVAKPDNEMVDGATQGQFAHSQLFRFTGDPSASVTLENFNILGNSPKSGVADNGLGLIFHKADGPRAYANNITSSRFFITFCPEDRSSQSDYIVKECRALDSYNTFLYNYGCEKCQIIDSEFTTAGGPAVIQNHVGIKSGIMGSGQQSNTKFVNSKITNWVTGKEAWFVNLGVDSYIPELVNIAGALGMFFGRTFVRKGEGENPEFNLISINNGDAEDASFGDKGVAAVLRGSQTYVDETTGENMVFDYGKTHHWDAAYPTLLSQDAPIFQTSAGGLAYFNGQTFVDMTTNTPLTPDIAANAKNGMANGNIICVYFQGMQLIMSYIPA